MATIRLAVMSTTRGANKSFPRIFTGRRKGTGHLRHEVLSQSENPIAKVGGQAVLGRQLQTATPWLTERHGYDPTCGYEYDRACNKSVHRIFKGHRERTGHARSCVLCLGRPPISWQSDSRAGGPCQKEKRTLPGARASVSDFPHVAIQYPRPGSGI